MLFQVQIYPIPQNLASNLNLSWICGSKEVNFINIVVGHIFSMTSKVISRSLKLIILSKIRTVN